MTRRGKLVEKIMSGTCVSRKFSGKVASPFVMRIPHALRNRDHLHARMNCYATRLFRFATTQQHPFQIPAMLQKFRVSSAPPPRGVSRRYKLSSIVNRKSSMIFVLLPTSYMSCLVLSSFH